jgi:hypothetical protein
MSSWNVGMVFDRTLSEEQAGDVLDRLTDLHASVGWEPDTQRLTVTVTLEAQDPGMALAVARWATAGAIYDASGAIMDLISAEVMTEEEQDRRLAQ